MSSYYRQQLEEYLKTVDVKADRVLGVGDAQQLTKGRTKSWEVGEYKILDLEQPHKAEHKVDIMWDLNLFVADYINWNKFNKEPGDNTAYANYFDTIFCLEVAEYLYNPLEAMYNLSYWLKPGGILYISFPFCYPVHQPIEDDMLRYTRRGATKLLEESGFEILEITPRTVKVASLRALYAAEKMRAAKDYPYHDEVGVIIKAKKL